MKKRLFIAVLAVVCCFSIVLGGCFSFGSVTVNNTYQTMSEEQFDEYLASFDGTESERLQVAVNRSLLSGVSILSSFSVKTSYRVQSFGGLNSTETVTYHQIASGSGVIVDLDKEKGDAYVITNCHVVYSDESANTFADSVYLYLCGQDIQGVNYNIYYDIVGSGLYTYKDYSIGDDEAYRIEAQIVAASVAYDIALLKVSGSEVLKNSNAIAASFAESDDVYYGQRVYAIGNPEGEGMAATAGIVSKESCLIMLSLKENPASDSDYNEYRVIRTDAAINGGNSGGGMYNADAKLVGIINSKSVSEDIDNMGYALPGSNVKRLWQLMRDAYEGGKSFSASVSGVDRVYLYYQEGSSGGVAYRDLGYKVSYTYAYADPSGMIQTVEELTANTTGYGLKVGDVIKRISITDPQGNSIEDRAVTRSYHLDDALLSYRQGYSVTLTVQRDGVEQAVAVSVVSRHEK